MPRPSKAAGSVALVTGANRGIGLAIVRELAARGARKIYAGVRAPADLAGEFGELGAAVEVVPLDVTDRDAVQAAAAACADVNLLVNNAGRFENQRLVLTGDPDAARREMEVNYFGVLNMTRAAQEQGAQEQRAQERWAELRQVGFARPRRPDRDRRRRRARHRPGHRGRPARRTVPHPDPLRLSQARGGRRARAPRARSCRSAAARRAPTDPGPGAS